MGLSAGVAVSVIGSAYSGSQQEKAAREAAAQQTAAGQQAIAAQQQALAQQREQMAPFQQAGVSALQRLTAGLQPGGEFTQQYALQQAQQQGMLGAGAFVAQESPAQQFATQQAMQQMQAQAQMGGQLLSSNALVGAGQLAGKIGAQYEQQAFNQWLLGRQQILGEQAAAMQPFSNLATAGQQAAGGTAGYIGQAGANIGNIQLGMGQAQAQATMDAAAGQQQMIGAVTGAAQYGLGKAFPQVQPGGGGTTPSGTVGLGGGAGAGPTLPTSQQTPSWLYTPTTA